MSTSTKPLAVVTGASSGIGYELARQFASHDYDLIVCAEDAGLQGAARAFEAMGAGVQAVQADLATHEGVHQLRDAIEGAGRPVVAIAFNAGVGTSGHFADDGPDGTKLEDELNLIQLNVVSTVHLAKHVLPAMVKAGSGRVLFTASIASIMPTPYQAVYGASKAFVLEFSESLRAELKDTGVTVTALMPGATDTNFFDCAGMQDTKEGTEGKKENSAEDVARMGYEALMAGKDKVVAATLSTKLQAAAARVLPDSVMAAQVAKKSEPGSAKT